MSLASLAGARIPHAGGGATFGTGAFYNSNPAIYTENFAVLSNGDMQGSTDGAKFIFSGCGISIILQLDFPNHIPTIYIIPY